MKRMVPVLALILHLSGSATAILTVSINGEIALPGEEIWLNRGDEVVLEVTGDGLTPVPLEGCFLVEGPGAINGCSMAYVGDESEYYDLEELAQAAGTTVEETLTEYRASTNRNISDASRWFLRDSELPEESLIGTLMTNIVFRCEGEGNVLLTLETDDEWTTYQDYTIIIHQTAETHTYYVDANTGHDNNTGLSPDQAFATIQKAIDSAYDGETIIARPGRYLGDIHFSEKNIVLRSTDPNDSAVVEQTIIGGDFRLGEPEAVITFSGLEEPNCRLWGFNIKGLIRGHAAEPGNNTRATISHCLLCNNMGNCGTVIRRCDGLIENCVIAGNNIHLCSVFDAAVESCYGTIRNCTFANHTTEYAVKVGDIDGGGTTRIVNCILDDLAVFVELGGSLEISHTNLRGIAVRSDEPAIVTCNTDDRKCLSEYASISAGPGIICTDPCFVHVGDGQRGIAGDYHLKSQIGRWDPANSRWLFDDATSRCIDAGNPGTPLYNEPWSPLNNRINMGAYGGTVEASKTLPNWSLLADLTNDGIVDGEDFAWLTNDLYSPERQKSGDLNRNGAVRMDDVAIFMDQWLKTATWN